MVEVTIEELTRRDIREFLDWVHDEAIVREGTNSGRTANKAREHLRAVMSWAWEQDLVETLPRFPRPRPQDSVGVGQESALPPLQLGTASSKSAQGGSLTAAGCREFCVEVRSRWPRRRQGLLRAAVHGCAAARRIRLRGG